MDNTKAEAYLSSRLEKMSDERATLMNKLNKIKIEIEETDAKIMQMSDSVDKAFEVFSPRPKKNDFAKAEVEKLVKRKDELNELCTEYSERCEVLEEDIKLIEEALNDEGCHKEDESLSEKDIDKNDVFSGVEILEQQENERSRIARDLHDSVVQVLTNLVHKCEICTKIIDVDSIRAKLELEIMSKTLRETIDEIRNIIYDLRPMSFDDLGFDVTLKRAVESISSNTDMNVNLSIEGNEGELSNIIKLTIYRIIQECANNSIKYSQGNNININFTYNDNEVKLEIIDDGEGFSDKEDKIVDKNTGFGIGMMKERVALLSGNIEINTEAGKGTIVRVSIPVK